MQERLCPSTEYAPVTFWSLNDKLNREEMERQLVCLKQAGFGGVFMHARVGLITLYMSDAWLDLIENAARFGASLGLQMYLYDEDMWPSGYGGGVVPKKDKDYREKALLYIDGEACTENDRVLKTYRGKSLVVRTASCSYARFNGGCFIDEMNPHAVRYFLETTHEKYFQKMGRMFGKEIKGIFTDEPCYNLHSFHPQPHTPFSEYAVARYERQTGKNFVDGCHLLFCEEEGFRQFRLDYYQALSEQFEEAFCKQYGDWCKAHGIALVGHLMAEETLAEQIAYTGGVMRHYKHFDVAGVDKLFRTNEQTLTLKQLTSVTETFAKGRALSECFAGMGQEATFAERKRTIDWQAVNGISFVNTHLSHYSMRGERKRDYPPNLHYQQPYFCTEKLNNDYTARLSRLIAESNRKVAVLVLLPYSTAVLSYDPNEYDKPLYVDRILTELTAKLESRRVEYHLITEEDFATFAHTDGACISVNEYRYSTLILPASVNIRAGCLPTIKAFTGQIYKIGTEVLYADGVAFEGIGGEYFADVATFLEGCLPRCKAVCDMVGDTDGVIATRRILDGEEFLFIANKSNASKSVTLTLDKERTFISLMEGRAYTLQNAVQDRALHCTLYPSGSLLLYEGEVTGAQALRTHYNDGVRFSLRGGFREEELAFDGAALPKENVMLLDRVSLYVRDRLVIADSPTSAVWHYHYYPLEDGTPFTAVYTFTVKDVPTGKIVALIENAENYDEITLNGHALQPRRTFCEEQVFDEKCKIDLSLTVCEIDTPLQTGKNVLRIRGKKYNNISEVCAHRWVYEEGYAPTEVENIFIVGDFAVAFDEETHLPYVAQKTTPTKGNIADHGYPFYSGKLTYVCKHEFRTGDQIFLRGAFAAAEIETGDGRYTLTHQPFTFVCERACAQITIRVYNTLYPTYGPHRLKGYEEKRWIDAGIHNEIHAVTDEYKVLPFGLEKIIKRSKEDEND